MPVTIHFGDCQKLLCNAVCYGFHFMKYVKKKCGISEDAEIVFTDLRGNVKEVEESLDEYADSSLTSMDGEEFVMVEVCRENRYSHLTKSWQPIVTYKPALKNKKIVNSQFKARLKVHNDRLLDDHHTKSYAYMVRECGITRRGTL
uniref:uncharacterized protein LOC120327275 n=1 Tax=Styela clava TaxID=7725 RepID=UPI00193A3D92|nr:uncharacterized protein LOC120327275 [Styela clava]